MTTKVLSLVFPLIFILWVGSSSALTIEGTFIGGTETGPNFGGGNIHDAFRAAANAWERVIKDKFVVHFDYGWGTSPGGTHVLLEQGGTPNRETRGRILLNPQIYSDGTFATLFFDPTPRKHKEFPLYKVFAANLSGGLVNVARPYLPPELGTFQDVVTIFMHEIGHGLGLSLANYSFISQSATGYISVQPPLDCAGTMIPLAANNFGVTSHIYADHIPGLSGTGLSPLMSSITNGERVYPSDLDILAVAQLSGFRHVVLNRCVR